MDQLQAHSLHRRVVCLCSTRSTRPGIGRAEQQEEREGTAISPSRTFLSVSAFSSVASCGRCACRGCQSSPGRRVSFSLERPLVQGNDGLHSQTWCKEGEWMDAVAVGCCEMAQAGACACALWVKWVRRQATCHTRSSERRRRRAQADTLCGQGSRVHGGRRGTLRANDIITSKAGKESSMEEGCTGIDLEPFC